MTETEKIDKEVAKTFNILRKQGLIVDVAAPHGIQTMLTAKGFEQHRLLGLFVQVNQADPNVKKENQRNLDRKRWTVRLKRWSLSEQAYHR